jgi:ketosteroid isomerase-like protein
MKLFSPLILLSFLLSFLLTGAVQAKPEDTPEDTVEMLFELDREFVQYRLKHGTYKAFAKYLAPDAVTLGPGVQPKVGLKAVLADASDKLGQTVTWKPQAGGISGDLGYTWGRFQIRMTKDGETKVVQHGKYSSTWKRQPDGQWKIVVDAFSLNDAPE